MTTFTIFWIISSILSLILMYVSWDDLDSTDKWTGIIYSLIPGMNIITIVILLDGYEQN